MNACMHACIHTYIHTYIHSYIHACVQTYSGSNKYLNIWTNEDMHEDTASFHEDTDSSAVCSVSDRKGLNPQDRSRQSLAAVWHQSHPY